jgi:hypothetical protein
MPAAMLTQDLLATCLLLTRGKTEISLEEVIVEIDAFQNINIRHFGSSRSDLRVLFMVLAEFELCLDKNLDEITLAEVISDILRYHDVYFNDEGSHWILPDADTSGYKTLRLYLEYNRFYDYPRSVLKARIEGKRILREFFGKKRDYNPGIIMDLLTSINYGYEVLFHCTRPTGPDIY